MSDAALFSSNDNVMYIANVQVAGYAANIEPQIVYLANVAAYLTVGDKLIGQESGAYRVIETIKRSNTAKTFDTFIELYKYKISVSSGVFQENEKVYVGANASTQTANATIHSTINTGGSDFYMYTSNQIGRFIIGNTVRGANSSAIGTISEKYIPEIEFGSGDIIYIENIDPLTRDTSQSETYKIILEF